MADADAPGWTLTTHWAYLAQATVACGSVPLVTFVVMSAKTAVFSAVPLAAARRYHVLVAPLAVSFIRNLPHPDAAGPKSICWLQ